jgi:methylated-DNA-[protein]-cysteine S-methyltransferase
MVADFAVIETPVGPMTAVVDREARLTELSFAHRGSRRTYRAEAPSDATKAALLETERQLREYFEGSRRDFSLAIHPEGSDFERQVWKRLVEIPYGVTTTYGAVALQLGMPQASQAVGKANGANPIPIIIPCHRVIGADGRLVGYGGGLDIKEALLQLEGALPPTLF